MEVSFYRGTTTQTPIIYVTTADLNFSLNSKTSFQVKLPYQAVQGRLANTSGIGDISVCFTRNIYQSDQFDMNFSLGAKIPTNESDKAIDGRPLPMYYQSSLGTYDLIAGLSLINRKWLFATGIQVPLNKNKNQFLWSRWEGSPEDMTYIETYFRANELRRGTDVMLRVERNWRFSRFNFALGALPIFRITKDERADAVGVRIRETGSTGMALSFIGNIGYSLDTRNAIRVLVGHKITQRDTNPDGLTRELVTTIGYSYRF